MYLPSSRRIDLWHQSALNTCPMHHQRSDGSNTHLFPPILRPMRVVHANSQQSSSLHIWLFLGLSRVIFTKVLVSERGIDRNFFAKLGPDVDVSLFILQPSINKCYQLQKLAATHFSLDTFWQRPWYFLLRGRGGRESWEFTHSSVAGCKKKLNKNLRCTFWRWVW